MSLVELVDVVLEEMAMNWHLGRIPDALVNHTSADAVKPMADSDEFEAYGNWCGSVAMLILLFPEKYVCLSYVHV